MLGLTTLNGAATEAAVSRLRKNLSASLEGRAEDYEDLGSPPNVGTIKDAKDTLFFDRASTQTIGH